MRLKALVCSLAGALSIGACADEGAGLPASELGAEISAAEARRAMIEDDVILIDVRTPGEWAQTGLARGAARVTLQDPAFVGKVEAITGGDRSAKIAFICRSGNRSKTARDRLKRAGYPHVTSVAGGMLARKGWNSEGYPTVSLADAGCAGADITASC